MRVRILETFDRYGDVIWKVQYLPWWCPWWLTKDWFGTKARAEKMARLLKYPPIEEI
jgi:hypothetical protein